MWPCLLSSLHLWDFKRACLQAMLPHFRLRGCVVQRLYLQGVVERYLTVDVEGYDIMGKPIKFQVAVSGLWTFNLVFSSRAQQDQSARTYCCWQNSHQSDYNTLPENYEMCMVSKFHLAGYRLASKDLAAWVRSPSWCFIRGPGFAGYSLAR